MAAAQAPLRPWNSNLQHSDRERWICIYPAYVNKKKTRQEGRRIPKENCVENPSFQEIRDVLQVLNLNVIVENKQYSREKSKELAYRGRIRVQLRNNDGSPILKEYPSRDSLLFYLGKMIPQLKTRQSKPNEQPVQQHASGSGGQSHKKGKGKRR
ncbi:signal recognition particle 19 kDa protein [Toxorhynchites rutilus septentrionalis]|uniref:signal recognition particle 19 kDa protein n=1 Tax=Toxorhynchites rutilus septentrionalis TaxID=329112 RepID=UPI00247AE855|nr:signal recognition particle 19 kDa protein [Toxorhynchites rutilus septentrionalis]